jgi:TonB family protein
MEGRSSAEYDILEQVSPGKTARGRLVSTESINHPSETRSGIVAHNGSLKVDASNGNGLHARPEQASAHIGNETMTNTELSSPADLPSIEGHELDSFLGKAFEEKPLWTDLYESIRDTLFPPKLPPLELTSQPIPVPDRMAVKTNPWAVGTATVVNGGILLIVLILGARQIMKVIKPPVQSTPIDVGEFKVDAPKASTQIGGGGGGGSHEIIDPNKGHLPKIDLAPKAPPMVPILEHPKLAVDSAIAVQKDIKLPDNPNLPMIGVLNSANVTLGSNGQGTGAGMGTGHGGGLGSGTGNGYGPGTGGNYGGGLERVGGLVSAPVPLLTPEAEFSDEARRAKYQGEVMISLIVDAQGNPQNPRVVRPLGMGLDEKALEAVRKYKFKPAMKQGKAVPVMITIAVNFRLY